MNPNLTLRALMALTLFNSFLSVFGQPEPINTIDSLMKEGQALLDRSFHEESISVYQTVQGLAVNIDSMEVYYDAENRITQNLWRLGKLEEAYKLAINNLDKASGFLGRDHKIVGDTYLQLGVVHLFRGEHENAINHFKEVERVFLPLGEDGLSGLSAIYVNMGYIYYQNRDLEELLKTYKKAYEIDKKLYDNHHFFVAEDLYNLATVYLERGMEDQAIEYLYEAKNMLTKLDNKGVLYANTLSSIGIVLGGKNQFNKAHDYFREAIQIHEDRLGEDNYQMSLRYLQIASLFMKKEAFDSGFFYLKKCLPFEEQLKKTEPTNLMYIYRDLAKYYSEKGDSATALAYNNKAFTLVANTSKSNELYAILLDNRSQIYKRFSAYDLAIKYLLDAIENYPEDSRSFLSITYRNLAMAYLDAGQFHDAIMAVQESMKLNHLNWNYADAYLNPPPEGVIDREDFFDALDIKSQALSALYKKDPGKDLLNAAMATYELLNKSIIDQRIDFTRIQDKIDLSIRTHRIYERAIALNYQAYLNTGEQEFLKKCFYYSEIDKSVTLNEALNERTLLKELLPIDVVNMEQDLRVNINNYHSILLEEKDSSKIAFYNTRLFDLNQRKDSLLQIIKNSHGDLYKSRYQTTILTIEEIQDRMDDNLAILEYFMGDSLTYGFLLKQDVFKVEVLGESDSLNRLIVDCQTWYENEGHGDSDWFVNETRLYNRLVAPFEDDLENPMIQDLIIIPSGTTYFVPFDLLIKTSKKKFPKNFKEADFLLKRFSIRMNYTIDFNKSNPSHSEEPKVLAFAPTYEGVSEEKKSELPAQFRDDYAPLLWNDDEISAIGDFFLSDQNEGMSATESIFKQKSKDFNILHLAMHAFVDDRNPMESRLIFTNEGDSVEDNMLHTFELFNMDLAADLAILSACKTGSGKLVRGEGVIGLAKGFSYAGVQNVIMSYWQVDDQSTSTLMSYYYEELAAGHGKSNALRLAKMRFLEKASPNKSHPFFWGGFVLVGDNEPVVQNHTPRLIILILTLLVGAPTFYFLKKRFA